MKFHWGHGITVFFIIFVGIMLTILYLSKQENIDLVTEEYYAEELKYGDRMEQIKNSEEAGIKLTTRKSNDRLILSFEALDPKTNGNVVFYRPSNAELDFSLPLELDSNLNMSIPLDKFSIGLYQIKAEMEFNNTSYYIEKTLSI